MKHTSILFSTKRYLWVLILAGFVCGLGSYQEVRAASNSIDITPPPALRQDPIRQMQEEMNKLMQDPFSTSQGNDPFFHNTLQGFFGGNFPFAGVRGALTMNSQLQTDIRREGDNLIVTLDMPGHDGNSIDLRIRDNVLLLRSERKSQKSTGKSNKGFFRREISYGKFSQNIRLPRKVIAKNVTATLQDGVLRVVAPLDLSAPEIDAGLKIPIQQK